MLHGCDDYPCVRKTTARTLHKLLSYQDRTLLFTVHKNLSFLFSSFYYVYVLVDGQFRIKKNVSTWEHLVYTKITVLDQTSIGSSRPILASYLFAVSFFEIFTRCGVCGLRIKAYLTHTYFHVEIVPPYGKKFLVGEHLPNIVFECTSIFMCIF